MKKTCSRCKYCSKIKPMVNHGGRCIDCWLDCVQSLGIEDDRDIKRYRKK